MIHVLILRFSNPTDSHDYHPTDDPCPDDADSSCENEVPCDDNYTYLNNIPNETVILDYPNNCFNNNDLDVLDSIYIINNLSKLL